MSRLIRVSIDFELFLQRRVSVLSGRQGRQHQMNEHLPVPGARMARESQANDYQFPSAILVPLGTLPNGTTLRALP